MKTLLLLLTGALVGSLAREIIWTPPPGMEDGLYNIYFPEDEGSFDPIIKRMGNITFDEPANTLPHPHDIVPRHLPMPVSKSGCPFEENSLDPDDHYATRQAFWNWCSNDRQTMVAEVQMALKGNVKYYLCNQDYRWLFKKPATCRLDEIKDAERMFNVTCGEDKAAWITMKDWAKTYGRSPSAHIVYCHNLN
ncbi:Fc.00g110390.m01.CDS01 [Cosmosporella sp. VM-42]